MSVDLDALKSELESAGYEATIDPTLEGNGQLLKIFEKRGTRPSIVSTHVFTWGTVASLTVDWPMLDIIRKYVAPAEPVTLTTDEWASMDKMLTWADVNATDVLKWLRENGFRLVRTGGVADGA